MANFHITHVIIMYVKTFGHKIQSTNVLTANELILNVDV
jgi:hypothetical protein